MKKLLGFLIIVGVLVLLVIFQAPETTSKIEKSIGLEGFTSSITGFKTTLDDVATNIPPKNEFIDTYNSLYSGAVESTQKVVDGIQTTKEKVDGVRETLSGAQQKIDTTIQTVKETQEKIQEVKQNIDDLQKVGSDLLEVVGSGAIK